MKFLEFLGFSRRKSASIAKERLQIIVSHESARHTHRDILKQLKSELIAVISKYVQVDPKLIEVQLERHGDQSVLELNVMLPQGANLSPTSAPANVETV